MAHKKFALPRNQTAYYPRRHRVRRLALSEEQHAAREMISRGCCPICGDELRTPETRSFGCCLHCIPDTCFGCHKPKEAGREDYLFCVGCTEMLMEEHFLLRAGIAGGAASGRKERR